jgi:dihydrofolate reductase
MYVRMRRLIYYVACTVDGFIAREDGSLDCFLTAGEHFADLLESFPETVPAHLRDMLGVQAENKRFDAVLMGRKTYEVGLEVGVTSPYAHLRQYLFSGGMRESRAGEVQLVSGDAVAMVKELKREAARTSGSAAASWRHDSSTLFFAFCSDKPATSAAVIKNARPR